MRPRLGPRLLAMLLLLAPMAWAAGDVITLDDGSVLEGVIISPSDAAVIELRVTAGGVEAVQRIDRHHVVRIDLGPSAHQRLLASLALQAQALGDQGGADVWLALSRQANAAGEHPLARSYAQHAVLRDRHLTAAHLMLGQVLAHGIWMTPQEAATARGEVYYEGHWMPWAEREHLLASERQTAHDAAVQRERLLAAQHDQRLRQELEVAEYGSASQDPFSPAYVESVDGGDGATGSGWGSVYGSWVPWVGGGRWHRHYGHGTGTGVAIVVSGQARSSSWALNLHW